MAVFTLTPGIDNFTGNSGEDNTFNFTQLTLQGTDSITGGATGSFIDILALTSAGTIAEAQFAGVMNIEQLSLFAAANVTLSNALVANSSRAGGRMLVVGSAGNDTIDGSQITNGKGLDVFAGDGVDTVTGGNGDDVLVAHTIANLFAAEHDVLSGGDGNDTLFGEAADTLSGGAGFDVLQVINDFAMNLDLVATGIEYVVSGFGNDVYTAAAATVTIEVYGGGGNDQITGGTVADNLWAGVGNDTLVGNDGADLLVGDLGADSLSGGSGNDRLYIDSDDTFIDGGSGFDAAYIATGTGVTLNMATSQLEWVTDFAGGNDTITAAGVAVGVEIYAGGGTDNITGSSNNDLIFAGIGNDTVVGGDGDDAIVGETGADSLSGGIGNDRLYIDSDDTLVDGGADMDAVYIVGGTGVTLNMATSNVEYIQDDVAGADTINGVGTGARVFAGGGDDTIGITNSSFTTISGGLGLDRLTLTVASQNFDLTANASRITGIEVISLDAALGATLSLTNTDIPQINATSNLLYVTGGVDDSVNINGADWLVVSTTHTNPAISGDVFTHYHNSTTNSDLFIENDVNQNVGDPVAPPVNTAPAAVTATEDVTFDFTGVNAISVADDGNVSVTLSVDHGVLNVTANPLVSGNGTNTLTIDFESPTTVNAILASLKYKGDLNFNGNETLTIVTSDSPSPGALNDTDTVAITVNAANDAPAATADTNTAVEDLIPAVTGNVLVNDTDLDGNLLTVSVASQGLRSGTYGNLQLNSNGSYTYTLGVTVAQQDAVQALAAGTTGSDTFGYTAFDGTTNSNSVNLVLTVAGTNDAPVVNVAIGTQTAPEDAPFSFAIPANAFSDLDTGDTLTYTNVGPLPAWLTFNGTNYVGTPDNGDVGSVTVAVRATDGSGAFAEQLFTINVTNTNDGPLAVADTAPQAVIAGTSLSVDAAHGVLANDSDVDGGTLSVSAMTGAVDNGTTFTVVGDHGTLVLTKATGAYTYTALPATPLDYGTDSFSYTVSDGQGGTSSSTLSIEVTEQGLRTLDAASLDGSGNIFVGTGNTGTSYNVSENHAAALELGLKIHYRTGNDIQPLSRDADGTAHYLVPLGLQAIDPAHNVVAASANRVAWSFDYSVDTDTSGSSGKTLANYNFSITISDGEGHTQIYDLQHLSATNTPWVLRGGPGTSNFGDEETGAAAASPTLSQNSVNIGFAFLQAAFGNNLAGKHFDIQLTATDAATGALAASVHDQIVVDTPPVATPNTASVTEDVDNDGITAGTQTFASGNVITDTVADSDANGNPITVSAVNGLASNVNGSVAGTYGTLVINTNGSYTYTLNNALPSVQALGATGTATETFTYTVTDGITPNASATATLTVTVHGTNDPVNSPPTVTADVTEDLITVTSGNVFENVTDADSGDTHTVTAVNGLGSNVGIAVTGTYGELTIDSAGNAQYALFNSLSAVQQLNTGSPALIDSFTYTVSDGHGSFATTTLNVSVHGTNDGPVARPDFVSVAEDTAVSLNVLTNNDSDVDAGDTLTVTTFNVGGGPVAAGTFVPVGTGGAQLTVESDGDVVLNQNGAYEFLRTGETRTIAFSYTITDTHGATDTSAISVTVTGTNDAPTLDLDTATLGDNFSTLATSGDTNTAISGNTAITDGIGDVEGRIKSIVLNLTATGGTDTGEGLNLPAGYEATLEGLGIATITGAGSSVLTITATNSFSPDVAESIIEAITHTDPDTTFNFNPEDRTITVTITDQNAGINAGASDVQTTTIDMAANVNDTTGVNSFVGANRADTIQGNTGGDVMEGRGGNDTIWGGTTAGDMDGTDIAVFTGNVPEYTITRINSTTYTVQDNTPGRDATDTVHDVEILRFDDVDIVIGAPIMVFNAAGDQLLATYAANQLDLAVAFADAASGANIIELRSAQGPFSAGAWPVAIDDAVTIKGVGGTAVISAGGNSAFTIASTAVDAASDLVRFEGLSIQGNGIAADTVGVLFNGGYAGASDGAIELVATSVSGFGSDGVAILGGGPGLSVTIDGDHPGVVGTQTAAFTGSGYNSSSGGTGDILFFEFTGNASLRNIVVTGTTGTGPGSADNGIQISGFQDGLGPLNNVLAPIGTVSFDNVSVGGTYEKNLTYIQGYNNFTGLSFAGVTFGAAPGSAATWTALFIDGGPQGGSYTLNGAVDATIDSTLNLAGITVAGGAYGTSPGFAALGSKQIVVNGTLTDDLITGTLAHEAIIGLTGNDTINPGGGNDLVVYNVGDGQDVVTDTAGIDALALVNLDSLGAPSGTGASWNITNTLTTLSVDTDAAVTTDEVAATGIEALVVQLGDGGDTVRLDGNLAGTGLASITVNGGALGADGADTLDARTLSSTNAITANLGANNDTFKAANVVASDTVNGAGGTGDTADYSAATAAVTINLALGTANGTSVGSDSITNFENAVGGAGGDSITGTAGMNTLTGNGGFDTLVGGGDNDTLVGGETGEVYTVATGEGDVASYGVAITRSMIAEDGLGGWTVASGEGTDSLSGIEIIDGLEAGRFLLVGNGGFADFAAAYSEATDGDTIVLAGNANYSAGFTITKSITISGVNYNTAGIGVRSLESVLTGEWSVNAAAPVVIEGVRFLNDATTTGNGIATLTLASSSTVQNSVFFSTETGGAPVSASDDRAIKVTATTGAVSILNNLITGDEIGKFGDASWGRGAITWGGGSTLNVQDNRIEYARTAMELTGSNTLLTLDDNTIFFSGSGLSTTGFSGNVTQITDTQFINVDTDWNDRFNSAANNVTWDLGATGNTSDNWLGILAGRGSDVITGTAGKDAILTNQGNDFVHGEENNDSVFVNVNTGNDVVDGGSETVGGKDTLIVSNVNISGSNGNALDPGDFGDPATTTAGTPSVTPVTFTMTDVGDTVTPTDGVNSLRDISITASIGGSTVADEIEDVQFNLGAGGDTVNITGDFTNTSLLPSTITVNGGLLNDIVNATGLISAHGIVFNGGGGNDTFFVSGAGGNDTFDGGSGTNTIDYSDVGNGVTVNLGNAAQQNTGDGLDTISNVQNVVGTAFNDTLTGTSGTNRITGGGGIDTSGYSTTSSALATFGFDIDGHWTVTIGGVTDTLIGVERLTFSDKTILLVDHSGADVGGYQTVQSAIDGAAGGETLLIRGGLTYSESHTTASGPAGIYINKAGLTLQGVTTTGALITDAATAQSGGPTIVSAHQNNFGANHWVDVNGDNTVFNGVHLKAGAETDNKVLEFWAQNVSVTNSFVDAYDTLGVYTFAVAIYINDNGSAATDEVTAYTINGNILNEGVIVANGVGNPSLGIGASQKITNNQFIDTFDYGTGLGRYDTVVINGQVNGVGWLLEPTQTPTITGNTVANNTVPFILRGSDNSAANLPTSAQIAVILANNFDANVSYAYVVDSTTGDLVLASRNDGGGPYRSFAVTNTIDTLNLALDNTGDAVFGSTPRDYIHAGDTIIVQSGAGAPVDSQIMVDNLKVQATANSADLDLTMATTFANGSPIPGGVNSLTLTNYAAGQGANVDVTGNALANTITGNSGANTLAGADGNDTLHGGGGDDALQGGVGVADSGTADKATYDNARANYTIVMTTGVNGIVTSFTDVTETTVAGVNEGHDTLSGIEVLEFSGTTFDLNDPVQLFSGSTLIGTFDTIQAAVDAAVDGNTVKLKALTYNENVTIHGKAITIDGVDDTLAGSVITGQITVDTTLDGQLTIKDVLINATGNQYGVFASANSTAFAGGITIDNVTIENAAQNGFAYVLPGNGTTPTVTDTIGAITFLNSAFSNNATANTGSGGRGDILLYGYNQDLTITDVVIGSPGAFAQKAIQMRGIEGGDTVNVGPYDPAGDVAINNLTISGGYAQDAIAFYRIASFASFTGANNNVNVTRSVNANPNAGLEPWAVINFDEVGGAIDLSGFFASASNLASPDGIVPAVPSVIATPQGLATADTFTGTSGMDVLVGRGGSDILHGGAGNDLLIVNAGDAVSGEIYDGGANTDTLQVTGNANFTGSTITSIEALTFTTSATSTVTFTSNQVGGGNLSSGLAVTGDGNANHIVVNMPGTTVDLSAWTFTNWTDGVDTITINGSAANDLIIGSSRDDIIDPAGATSPPLQLADQYNVIHAGGGNDLMFSGPTPTPPHGFAGNVFDGGTGNDTVDYGNAPGPVLASLAAGRTFNFGNGYGGTDWFTDGHPWDFPGATTVENLLGSGFGDTLIGDLNDNLLSGRAGNDQLNGGGGIDQLFGGDGDDTFTYDLVTGGQATVDGGEGAESLTGDTQIVNGTVAGETWYINPITGGYLGIDNETGADTAANATNYEVRTKDVEKIVLNTGGGSDTVVVSGDLAGTGVATSTVTVDGGGGDDILDASGVNGAIPVRVVLQGGAGADVLKGGAANDTLSGGTGAVNMGTNAYTGDRADYAGSRSAYTISKTADGTFTVAGPGAGTDTLTGVEGVTFANTLTGGVATPPIAFELDSNSVGLATAASTLRYDQGFVTDTGGFTGSGATTRKINGEFNGVSASDGDGNYAVVTQSVAGVNSRGPNTVFDGYRSDWTGGYIAKVDIYLDPTMILPGEGFDVSTASNKADGTFLRDYFFHVTHDTTPRPGTAPTKILVGGSNTTGANNDPRQDLDTINNAEISTPGWYTFEWKFYQGENGALEVAMNLYNSSGNWLFTEVRNDGADLISSVAGGNRYMWFTDVDVAGGLAIDNVELRTVDDNPVQLVKGTGGQLGGVNANTIVQSYDTIGQALADAQSGNIIDLAAKDYTLESPVTVNVNNLTFRGPAGAVNVDLTLGTATNVTLDRDAAIDVTGNGSNNIITGNLGANTLQGLGGDDTLHGGGGNDNLQGGLQTIADTATYDDARANYTLVATADANGFAISFDTLTETSGFGAVNEGADTLSGIELLQFSGTTLDINDAVQLFDNTNQLIGTFDDIKSAVDAANANAGATFTIRVEAGTVSVGGAQVMINKNITIDGAGIGATTVLASADTGNSGDARGMFLVSSGKTFNVSDLTLDGDGHKIYQGIRYTTGSAGGDIDRVHFEDMQYEPSGGFYQGVGVAVLSGDVDVTSSVFTNMGRIGVIYFGAGTTGTVLSSDFTGKGAGNWLDYAVEVGGGATAEITGNTVTGNLGVATVDSSASAAFLVTTAFAAGTAATLGGNIVTNSTMGLAAGSTLTDTSAITFNAGNDFTGNGIDGLVGTGSVIRGNVAATGTTLVDGTYNWFGGAGANQVIGADLNDTLRGGTGVDNVQGNGGDDVLVWNAGDGNDTIGGGSHATGDTLQVNGGASNLTVTAGSGNFTVGDGVGTATVSAVEEVNITLGSGTTATVTGDFQGTGINVNTITVTGAGGNETVDASAMVDGSNTGPGDTSLVGIDFTGGAGNDTFRSGIGNDAFHGGADVDTAVYGATYGSSTVTWDGTTATVTGARGTDTYDGVGKIVFNDRTVWLVNDDAGSEYTTIAQLFDTNTANGEAANGDVIMVAAGTYTQSVTVNKQVTILGANEGTAGSSASRVAETNITGGLAVTADNVVIDGVKMSTPGVLVGAVFAGIHVRADFVSVTNALIVAPINSNGYGVIADSGNFPETVDHLSVTDSKFDGWRYGIYTQHDLSDVGDGFETITGNTFTNHEAGIRIYDPDNATITGNTFTNNFEGIEVNVRDPAGEDVGSQIGAGNVFSGNTRDIYIEGGGAGVVVEGTAYKDTFGNFVGGVTLRGAGDNDNITGSADNDTIDGGGGTDTVDAGGGNDTVIGTADTVNDSYTGGTGTDTLDYSALTSLQSISVNLAAGFASGASIGTDTLSSFENVNGGAGDDSLFGSSANNVIHGNGGIDNIVGSNGSDQLFGEAGNDTLNGGVNDFGALPSAANDVLWGGADKDTFKFEGRFGDDAVGAVGTPDWVDNEDLVFVGYATRTPTILDVAGGVLITIDDTSVASSVFVAGANSALLQQVISGADLIIH